MNEVKIAIELREKGQLKESNEILIKLVKDYPNNPTINYQCAWSFDVMGLEKEAIPYYEKAILLGLQDEDLRGAFLGLGSTYRTLGQYQKSKEVLEKGLARFTDDRAMEILLIHLAYTSSDENIKAYKKAIEFYSNKLDRIW